MFRHFTFAIFRLINEKKNLVNSYTGLMWVVYSGEVRGKRYVLCRMGGVGTVHGFCYYMIH